jgi:hypothetical protein
MCCCCWFCSFCQSAVIIFCKKTAHVVVYYDVVIRVQSLYWVMNGTCCCYWLCFFVRVQSSYSVKNSVYCCCGCWLCCFYQSAVITFWKRTANGVVAEYVVAVTVCSLHSLKNNTHWCCWICYCCQSAVVVFFKEQSSTCCCCWLCYCCQSAVCKGRHVALWWELLLSNVITVGVAL